MPWPDRFRTVFRDARAYDLVRQFAAGQRWNWYASDYANECTGNVNLEEWMLPYFEEWDAWMLDWRGRATLGNSIQINRHVNENYTGIERIAIQHILSMRTAVNDTDFMWSDLSSAWSKYAPRLSDPILNEVYNNSSSGFIDESICSYLDKTLSKTCMLFHGESDTATYEYDGKRGDSVLTWACIEDRLDIIYDFPWSEDALTETLYKIVCHMVWNNGNEW
jgi:hypothetical protein